MAQSTTIPYEKYPSITKFIVQHIQDQNLGPSGGIAAKALVQSCMDQFSAADGDAAAVRKEVADSIRKMHKEKELKAVSVNGGTGFRLHPFNVKEKSSRIENAVSSGSGSPENKENERIEFPGLSQLTQVEREPSPESASAQVGKEDARRHSKAYAEMTRGANPLPPAQLEGVAETPSRKRRRIMEVSVSDRSSSMDPISPGRYPNSTPRRPLIRLGTPLSDSRRRSAPTSLFSPLKLRSPRETRERADIPQTMFKDEKKDSSPPWLIAGLNTLHSKYPNDSFKAENGTIKCMDCERLFKPGGNNSVSNFETHLRSKTHRNSVTERMEKFGSNDFVPQHFFLPGKTMGMDFTIPQQPLTVFAHKSQQSVESLRTQYLTALEREVYEKAIRTTLVEGRLLNAEKTNKERFEQIDASLEASEKKITEQLEEMSETVTSSEERCKEQVQEVKERLASSESRSKDQQDQFIDMVARVTSTEERCNSKLDDMTGRLARSDHRNIHQLEKLQERFDVSVQKSKDRLQRSELPSYTQFHKLTSLVEDSKLRLEESERTSKEQIDQVSQQITASELELKDRLRNSEQNLEVSIYALKVQVEQSEQASKEEIDQLSQQIIASEEMLKQQEGIIDDLESKSQLYADEIQRSRESGESFRKALSDQMEAHFEQTAKRAALFEAQTAERLKGIELMMVERMKESEKKMKETEKRMKTLKEDNEYQEEVIVRLEKVIPALMQEMQELREYAKDFETRLAAVTRVKEESPFMFSKVRKSSAAR